MSFNFGFRRRYHALQKWSMRLYIHRMTRVPLLRDQQAAVIFSTEPS